MKPQQRANYAERIDRVVRYLETAADETAIRLADLAGVAAMSPYHFHRIYRLMTGETIGETVRRLRLARSLPALASDTTVTAASADSGYGTPQGFARALRAQVGVSPSAGRADVESLTIALSRARRATRHGEPVPAMSVDIVSVEPFKLLAIRNIGAYEELNGAYRRLFQLVTAQMAPACIVGLYGVQYDDPRFTPAGECRATCAFDVGGRGSVIEPLEELTLGGGRYARLRHNGSYNSLATSIDVLYAYLIDTAGFDCADRPLHIHYLDDPDDVPEAMLRSDVYVPLI